MAQKDLTRFLGRWLSPKVVVSVAVCPVGTAATAVRVAALGRLSLLKDQVALVVPVKAITVQEIEPAIRTGQAAAAVVPESPQSEPLTHQATATAATGWPTR